MWKSEVQLNWEIEARKIGIEIKKIVSENIFVDYWDLPWDSKVEDLEEEVPLNYKINFYKKFSTYKKKRSYKKNWTHRKRSKYNRT